MSQFSQETLFEAKVEQLCTIILITESEFWETKNKAVNQLTQLFTANYNEYAAAEEEEEGESTDDLSLSTSISPNRSTDFMFTPEIFRLLKEPIKCLISDLRSQQVRDACTLLSKVTSYGGERSSLKLFLRDSFGFILEGVKVPNKVMSGFVHDSILSMIQSVTFKSALAVLCTEAKDNKAKLVRERCLEYLNEALIHWEMNDKELDMIGEAIVNGLEDAAVNGRELARTAFVNLHRIRPKKAEKLKIALKSNSLKAKLDKACEPHDTQTGVAVSPPSKQKRPSKQPLVKQTPVSRVSRHQSTGTSLQYNGMHID